MAAVEDIIRRLEVIDEELSDLAILKLRDSLEGEPSAAAEEKVISRARRAVEKAAGLLAGMPGDATGHGKLRRHSFDFIVGNA